MAYTATLIKHNVIGNQRMLQYNVTADANSGAVATPLGLVESIVFTPISMNTLTITPKFKPNLSAASAAANGSVFMSSCTNGDNFFLIVYGRS